jgi:hypothetical protein
MKANAPPAREADDATCVDAVHLVEITVLFAGEGKLCLTFLIVLPSPFWHKDKTGRTLGCLARPCFWTDHRRRLRLDPTRRLPQANKSDSVTRRLTFSVGMHFCSFEIGLSSSRIIRQSDVLLPYYRALFGLITSYV